MFSDTPSRVAHRRHVLLALAVVTLGSPSLAQAPQSGTAAASSTYEPRRGQPGKDVIWIPTPDAPVLRMLRLAQVTPQDHVIDLGSGDGKIVLAAAREGTRAHGVEYNPEMVELSKRRAQEAGLQERATFEKADIFEMDFSRATVITMYLLPELNLRLRPKILSLKPGTRAVSHDFRMGDWQPDETSTMGSSSVHLWIVPANIGGKWQLRWPGQTPIDLSMDQTFQQFTGKAAFDKMETTLRETQLRGDAVQFAFTDARGVLRQFNGNVSDDRIEGTVEGSGVRAQPFTAQRMGKAPALNGTTTSRLDETPTVGGQ